MGYQVLEKDEDPLILYAFDIISDEYSKQRQKEIEREKAKQRTRKS